MTDGSKRPKHLQVLWCLWVALLMTAPYPAGMGELWFIGFGAVSESRVFAYVSAGIVAGLWVATMPRVERMLVINHRVRASVVALGILLSVLALAAVWLNVVYTLFARPDYANSWTAAVQLGVDELPFMAVLYRLGDAPKWIALSAGFLCGCSAIGIFHKRIPRAVVALKSYGEGDFLMRCALCLVLGLLQASAWVLLMPHSQEFPQRLPEVDSIGSIWGGASMGVGLVALMLPFIFTCIFAFVSVVIDKGKAMSAEGAVASGEGVGNRGLLLLAFYCLGVIGYRLLVRIDPGLLRISLTASATCTACYVALFALYCCVVIRESSRHSSPEPGTDERLVPASSAELPNVSNAYRQALAPYALSEKELVAVWAYELGFTAAQTANALGIAEPTVREYRRRSRVKMHVSTMDDAVSLVRGLLGDVDRADALPGGDGEGDGCPRGADLVQSPRWLKMLSELSLFSLMLGGCLLLFPINGAVTVWSDVWTTGFGLACGLILAWACSAALSLPVIDLRKNPAVMCAALLVGYFISSMLVMGMQSGILSLLPEPAHRAAYVTGLALSLCCLVVSFLLLLWLGHGKADDGRIVVICGTASVACAAISGVSVEFWVVATALSVAVHALTLSLLLAHGHKGGASLASGIHNLKAPSAYRLAWLLVAGMVMWTWGEIWRSQAYESSVLLLQGCVAALLFIAVCRLWARSLLDARGIFVLSCQFVVLLLVRGMAIASVVTFVVVAMHATAAGRDEETAFHGHAWHNCLLSGAFCLVVGTLATNYAGSVKVLAILEAIDAAYDSGLLVGAAVLAMSFLVVVLLVFEATSGEEVSLSLEGEARVKTALMARGLSDSQVSIALLLARGFTVGEVAEQLSYSRSTVALARRVVYSALGVTDRASLGTALRTLSEN